ncbi:unnamed protein product [Absidia cylindrospora]
MTPQSPKTMGTSPRGRRERFLPEQVSRLEEVFSETQSPTSTMKDQLTKELGTTRRRVQVWFQNQRSKSKRQKSKELSAAAATAAATAATAAANDHPAQSPNHHDTCHDQTPILPSPMNLSNPTTSLNTGGIMERTSSIIHPRRSHSNMTSTLLYQPTYSIDKYYTHSLYLPHHQNQQQAEHLQHTHVFRTLPPLTSNETQHPSSLRHLPQTMIPSFYVQDGPSFFENRQTQPPNYISVIPNPSAPYFLSHEGQQSHPASSNSSSKQG